MSGRSLKAMFVAVVVLFAAGFFASSAQAQADAVQLQRHAENLALWAENGPEDYQFEYSESCAGCAPSPAVSITVRSGEVTAIDVADGSGLAIPDSMRVTVDDLFDRVLDELSSPTATSDMRASYDAYRYGHPTYFATTPHPQESQFRVSDLRSLNPWPEVQAALDAAEAKFTASTYTVAYQIYCWCLSVDHRGSLKQVRVVDGEVVSYEGVPDDWALSVPAMFDAIQTAITEDVDRLEASFDPVLGHPTDYFIDPWISIRDEEYGVYNIIVLEGAEREPASCRSQWATVDLALGQQPTTGDDVIVGTPGADVIDGLGGRDLICGGGGRDLIDGGPGNDLIYAGGGHDVVWGGPGSDQVYGQLGADQLHGGADNDRLFGGVGFDTLYGDAGDDFVFGAGGDDSLYGGAGDDRMFGRTGDDRMWGGAGDDQIYAASGDDEVWGGDGDDRIQGASGDDFLNGVAGFDTIYGKDGNDTLIGGGGSDILYAAAGDDVLDGGDSSDSLHGGAGNDTLRGGAGRDLLYGQAGDDDLDGGTGPDTCWPGMGADTEVNC